MRSRSALAALLAAGTSLAAVQATEAQPKSKAKDRSRASFEYTLPGDRVFPEGIAVSADEGRFYVSSTTDGTIFRGRTEGRAASVFLPGGADGRTTAVGLKVDRGRLFVAGGATGSVWVYDLGSRKLIRRFDSGPGGFINDIAIAQNGDAYVTDSQRPSLYRIPSAGAGTPTAAPTPLERFAALPDYRPGFNANGIVAVDPKTLIYVNSGLGRLYRVDVPSKTVEAIDLGGASVSNGDGLALRGRFLYVVRNMKGLVTKVRLATDARSGVVVGEGGNPTFRYPTTAALVGQRLLVVNSQFDKRMTMQPPAVPFTVSSIGRP